MLARVLPFSLVGKVGAINYNPIIKKWFRED
jgi:hypothetical protein